MALYETRLHRIITKNRKELEELQTKRLAAEASAREEAELFLANELSKNQVVTEENIQVNGAQQCGLIPTSLEGKENIEVNGFVFSIKTVCQEMAWKQTLAEARWYKSQNWDRTKQPPFARLTFPKAA